MSKNSSKIPSNCIIVSKGGSLKEIRIAESEMNRTKYAALCKTPPTYEGAFKRHTTWNVKKYGIIVELWARSNGRAGQENKYDFPPPVDETLFFGDCILVSIAQSPLTCSVWKKAYAHLFGGFDDLEKLADQDDAELDELEHVPNKKKTKHGYLKDGFIIDDAPRTKRSSMTMTTNPILMKLTTAGDAFSHDSVECNNNCDKTIADLIRRGHTYKHKIKDTECLNDVDEEDDEDDVEDEDDEDDVDEEDDEDDVDDDKDDDGENDDSEDEDDTDTDIDTDTDVNVDVDHVTDVKALGTNTVFQQSVTLASQTQARKQPIVTSNKKRTGVRVNNGKKRGATTEFVKCDNIKTSGDDKRAKQTNLDSELEEESYI